MAHMAHVGGFFIAYLVARPIAKGGPSELFEGATIAGGFSQSSSIRRRAKESMGGLESDPWERADKPLQGRAARILVKLRAEGDELETRRAWLEELAENTVCPICNGEIIAIVENESCTLRCGISPAHIEWP